MEGWVERDGRLVPHGTAAVLLLLVALVVLVGTPCVAGTPTKAKEFEERGVLWVGLERKGERLTLDSRQGASYRLSGLRPGTLYEARLSYPATNPVQFQVWFMMDDSKARGSSRTLLNVVQRRFNTNPVAHPHGITVPLPEFEADELLMFVSAEREGIAAPNAVSDRNVLFNIVVEELAMPGLGGLPGGTWAVLGGVVGSVAFAAFAATKLRRLLLLRPSDTKTA